MKLYLAFALIILGAFFYLRTPAPPPQTTSESAAVDHAPPLATKDKLHCQPGKVYRSFLNFSSDGTLSFKSGDQGQEIPFRNHWSGTISRYCLYDDFQESTLYAVLKLDTWQDSYGEKIGRSLRESLEAGIFWQQGPASIEFKINGTLTQAGANLWQLLALSYFRCHSPKQVDLTSCQENIPQGRFEAHYEGSSDVWRKRFSWGELSHGINEAVLRVDQGRYLQISQKQQEGIGEYLGQISLTAGQVTIEDIDEQRQQELQAHLENARYFEYKRANITFQDKSPKAVLGSTTFEDLRQLEQATGQDFLKMIAWLRLEQDNISTLVTQLTQEDFSDNSKWWVQALAKLGTPEAQGALIDLLSNPSLPESSFQFTAVALAMVESPSPEAEKFFKNMVSQYGPKDRGKIAAYGLGIAANQSQDPQSTIDFLRIKLQESQAAESHVYIRALGNIKDPAVVAIIQPYLTHKNNRVAADALYALRFHSSAQPLILAALESNSSAISQQAAKSLAFQLDHNSAEKVFQSWHRISNPGTRSYLLNRITSQKNLRDLNQRRLAGLLDKETHDPIRRSIHRYLERL